MPSTPTTKSQVQAYRFVLRRMQSALVRKDAVMLHDPMRTHSRATVVGVCLAALGLLGFLIWGILSPKPQAPNEDGIVIGKPSGQVYVMIAEPDRKLIPVFNLASARLLLYARDQQEQQGGEGEAAAAAPAAPADVVDPTVVDDNELRDIPVGRKVGIANGPELLPSADQRVEPYWTVCDEYQRDTSLNDPTKENIVETTVLAGVTDLGGELAENESLLVRAENAPEAEAYLVYRTPGSANLPNTSAVRARVDLTNDSVRAALDLTGQQPRVISEAMLNAITTKKTLATPVIQDRGDPSDLPLGDEELENIGSVFKVNRAGAEDVHYVVLRDGIEEVKETTANLIRYYEDVGTPTIPTISPDVITGFRQLDTIDDTTFPERNTEVLTADAWPVACYAWNGTGTGEDAQEHTSVRIGKRLPGVELDSKGDPVSVPITTPSADGIRIDHFYMPPGRGAVVRQATSAADFGSGQIALISARGVKYGVPDAATAQVLGLNDMKPAPANIVKLLPDGASLNWHDVDQSYDTTPFEPGQYPSEEEDQQSGSGSDQSGGG